ncbi:MAG: AraC family transcriptional regulator [Betaproteobacteria bacterium]|nr:AraC family transcriptional regulator [Betaproteobacteria bacterium]
MDALSELLQHLRLNTRIFHRSLHCGSWVLDAEYERKAMFHLVASGRCELHAAGHAPAIHLARGDVVMFARPTAHVLNSDALEGHSPDTLLLCGYFEFQSPLAQVILAALPELVLLRHSDAETGGASAVLELIVTESSAPLAGGGALIDKLADALFIYVLRHCIRAGATRAGFLRGIADPRLGSLLLELQRKPAEAWTVERMAAQVHLSRAAFARRFLSALGVAPMTYLTQLRMQLASIELTERGASVADAAARIGYATEAAFSRAFKRHYGFSPGSARLGASRRRKTERRMSAAK